MPLIKWPQENDQTLEEKYSNPARLEPHWNDKWVQRPARERYPDYTSFHLLNKGGPETAEYISLLLLVF